MPNRRTFLSRSAAAAAVMLAPRAVQGVALSAVEGQRTAGPRAHEFAFARLRYTSGDWDYNPKVAANVLNSLVEYTTIPVYPEEVVISADSDELLAFPFLFMTGHKLVRFSQRERERIARFVEQGGLLFSDDCNHDVEGLYARSFEEEIHTIFPGPRTLAKLPGSHPIYRSFFPFPEGPPATSHELNGWGRDRSRLPSWRRRPRLRTPRRALQQQGLRLRVGLRLAEQALSARRQHQVRRQHRRLFDDVTG
jgi:hypothetical protein